MRIRASHLISMVTGATLCIAVSAHKPATPLVRQASRLLRELVVASAAPGHAHNRMR